MYFNKLIDSLLKEDEELSRQDRIDILKKNKDHLQTRTPWELLSKGLQNEISDIIRNICTIETDGIVLRNIIEKSDPEVVEETGDGHNGSMTIGLTLPLKHIESDTPEDVLRRWQLLGPRYGNYGDLDIDSIDFENFDFEDYGMELRDLYGAAVRFDRSISLISVKHLNNEYGRFVIEISWWDDT